MMPVNERLLDLMALRATDGLDARESREFERLAANEPDTEIDAFDVVAAAIQVAYLEEEPMPAEVRRSLKPPPSVAREVAPRAGSRLLPISGWLAAAAILVVSVLLRPGAETTGGFDEARAAHVAWKPVDPAGRFAKVSGEVVWDESSQRGYMLFRGLPVNDPKVEQYQLWIVDGREGHYKHPVDGGVFDAGSDGEIRVPIDAKLPVRGATTFVLTAEQPGGVVVSDGPFLVLAKR